MAISNTIGVTKLAMGIGDGGNSYIPRASFATTYHPPAWTRKVRQLESTSTVQTRSRIAVRDVSCWPIASLRTQTSNVRFQGFPDFGMTREVMRTCARKLKRGRASPSRRIAKLRWRRSTKASGSVRGDKLRPANATLPDTVRAGTW
jgi:hypothetical protein